MPWCSHSETAAWFPLQICTDAKWLRFHWVESDIKYVLLSHLQGCVMWEVLEVTSRWQENLLKQYMRAMECLYCRMKQVTFTCGRGHVQEFQKFESLKFHRIMWCQSLWDFAMVSTFACVDLHVTSWFLWALLHGCCDFLLQSGDVRLATLNCLSVQRAVFLNSEA